MDWVAAVLELVGMLLVGQKNRKAFIVLIMANMAWFCFAIEKESKALFILMVAFVVVNIRNWYKWRR